MVSYGDDVMAKAAPSPYGPADVATPAGQVSEALNIQSALIESLTNEFSALHDRIYPILNPIPTDADSGEKDPGSSSDLARRIRKNNERLAELMRHVQYATHSVDL